MKDSMVTSPIFYMGNKKKLIKKGLIELFPSNIDTFIDLFAGSASVSMNVAAKKYIINDIDKNLIDLYSIFKTYSFEHIIHHIEERIEKYGLARERTKRNQFDDKDKLIKYKNAYLEFRNYFNSKPPNERSTLDFYTLMFYSFSQQFRFNSKGNFNMPVGNDCFSEKNKQYIEAGIKFFRKDYVFCCNKDFRELKLNKLSSFDFVYLDPPYLNTTAVYNENDGWNLKDEEDLFSLCESLNARGIKFGLSNVFKCKNKENAYLIEWCKKCGWNVYTFDNFTYMACGKGNSEAKEVFICNY